MIKKNSSAKSPVSPVLLLVRSLIYQAFTFWNILPTAASYWCVGDESGSSGVPPSHVEAVAFMQLFLSHQLTN